MKKTITHPDGRKEEYEGTPAELAELERAIQEGKPVAPKGKKRILTDEVERLAREAARDEVQKNTNPIGTRPLEPFAPWVYPTPRDWTLGSDRIQYAPDTQECAFDRLFREGHTGPIGLVCGCRKCSIQCTVRNGDSIGSFITNEMRPEYNLTTTTSTVRTQH